MQSRVATSRPELRRVRVGELLTMPVVAERVTRDQAMHALWPDSNADTAAANLRVTLSRLRQLLEPVRPASEATFFLRIDGQFLWLGRVPALQVDLWELELLTPSPRRDGESGVRRNAFSGASSRHLSQVVAIWRGDPLPDLERLADFAPQVERVRQRLFDAALRLGELYITEGRGIDAAQCAERVLGVDPHLERAHRLSVAARLVDGDARGAAVAVQRLEAWLAELG